MLRYVTFYMLRYVTLFIIFAKTNTMQKKCNQCGNSYTAKKKTAKYCSNACKQDAFRIRHGIERPSFLSGSGNNHNEKNINNTVLLDQSPTLNSHSPGKEILNILIQKKQYAINRVNELNKGIMPYTTVGGLLVGSALFDAKNRLLGAALGGAIGYTLGNNIDKNSTLKNHNLKLTYTNAISEINKQIEIVKKTEISSNKKQLVKQLLFAPSIKKENIKKDSLISTSKIINSHELHTIKTEYYDFIEPYKSFFGNPSNPFSIIVFGLPKSGKSNFSIQFARYLANNFGRTLYISSEEGFNKSLKDKIEYQIAHSKNFDISNAKSYDDIKDIVNPYEFVFIDSINYASISVDKLEQMKVDNPKTSFISIVQSTKSGNFKGSQEFAHNCDVIVNVAEGIANQIGRFNQPSSLSVF